MLISQALAYHPGTASGTSFEGVLPLLVIGAAGVIAFMFFGRRKKGKGRKRSRRS
jgi:hypothetical protein